MYIHSIYCLTYNYDMHIKMFCEIIPIHVACLCSFVRHVVIKRARDKIYNCKIRNICCCFLFSVDFNSIVDLFKIMPENVLRRKNGLSY